MWKMLENCHFSGRIWPDWGKTAWADMAGLGSIGLSIGFLYPNTSMLIVAQVKGCDRRGSDKKIMIKLSWIKVIDIKIRD